MRYNIAVWQEAYGSVRQTQRLFTENLKLMLGFIAELRNNAWVENCYFQQDRTPAHYTRKVRDYLIQF